MNMMFKINNDSYNLPLNIFSSDVIAVSCVLKTTVLLSLSSWDWDWFITLACVVLFCLCDCWISLHHNPKKKSSFQPYSGMVYILLSLLNLVHKIIIIIFLTLKNVQIFLTVCTCVHVLLVSPRPRIRSLQQPTDREFTRPVFAPYLMLV